MGRRRLRRALALLAVGWLTAGCAVSRQSLRLAAPTAARPALAWRAIAPALSPLPEFSEAQIIVRVPPAAPTVTITAPTASATYDAGTASSIAVSGTASTLLGVQRCTWTNDLGGSGTTVGFTPTWAIASVALTVGSNVVTVSCIDGASQVGVDVITITRSGGTTNPIAPVRMPSGTTTVPDPTFAAVGVESGIPTRTRCTTGTGTSVLPSSSTAAQINTAITGCDANHYVELGTGTFNLTTGITFHRSNVTLKGQGANNTRLMFSGGVGGCNYFVDAAISICTGDQIYGDPNGDGSVVFADVQTTWTPLGAGGSWVASVGTTQLTMASTSGLAVGLPIIIDQLDDTSDGYPAPGDLYVCGSSACSSQGGGGNAARNGRAQTQIVKVTAISGSTVTIDPPLMLPNWRSTKSPGAYWNTNANDSWLHDSGVEDLSIDTTSIGASIAGIAIHAGRNVWVKGVRGVTRYNSTSGNDIYFIQVIYGFHITLRDSYFYGPLVIGNQRYGFTLINVSASLFENNIFHHVVGGIIPNGPTIGNVMAYNYERDAIYATGGTVFHGMTMMNLHEGNRMSNLRGDIIHAPHYFEIGFRNLLDDDTSNPAANRNMPGNLETYSRFWSYVGNVLGGTGASVYEKVCASESCGAGGPYGTVIYELGWGGDNTGVNMLDDGRVAQTLHRWFNYDTVTATTRCVSGEVPTAITSYANALPGACAAPASLYLPARPPFFGPTIPWPLTGPDVTGGNIAGFGGHANKTPAQLCFEASADDTPAYPAGSVKSFNAGSCYPAP